jgi:hypothetical protein
MHTKFWLGNVKGRDDLEDLDTVGRRIIFKSVLEIFGGKIVDAGSFCHL